MGCSLMADDCGVSKIIQLLCLIFFSAKRAEAKFKRDGKVSGRQLSPYLPTVSPRDPESLVS